MKSNKKAHAAKVAAATERRRRFQLFAAYGVPVRHNPNTPPRRG